MLMSETNSTCKNATLAIISCGDSQVDGCIVKVVLEPVG